jgi:hypothetical protein
MYDAGGNLGKQQALKSIELIRLPKALFFHLKRFEYNHEKEKNIKIMDKYEFY